MDPKTYTKASLIAKLNEIARSGWIVSRRPGNSGAVGNTLEDLLGIEENNLPIPNAAEWELKAQRADSGSLTTLIHTEPSPRALRFVPKILLLKYGWPHQQAGLKHPAHELSFRQTLNGCSRTDRGFGVVIDRKNLKIEISFDASHVDKRHDKWLKSVAKRIGLGELDPQPYWGFDDLAYLLGAKLPNAFYVVTERKLKEGVESFRYSKAFMLRNFSFEGFLNCLEKGHVLVDFDARTGHNHGTKFRLRQNMLPLLYQHSELLFDLSQEDA